MRILNKLKNIISKLFTQRTPMCRCTSPTYTVRAGLLTCMECALPVYWDKAKYTSEPNKES